MGKQKKRNKGKQRSPYALVNFILAVMQSSTIAAIITVCLLACGSLVADKPFPAEWKPALPQWVWGGGADSLSARLLAWDAWVMYGTLVLVYLVGVYAIQFIGETAGKSDSSSLEMQGLGKAAPVPSRSWEKGKFVRFLGLVLSLLINVAWVGLVFVSAWAQVAAWLICGMVTVALFINYWRSSRVCVSLDSATPGLPDRMNRAMLIRHCVDVVLENSGRLGGARIAITGAWGTGKTHLMELVRQELADRYGIPSLIIDPWAANNAESALEMMLDGIERLVCGRRPVKGNILSLVQKGLPSIPGAGVLTDLHCLLVGGGESDVETRLERVDRMLGRPILLCLDDMERADVSVIRAILPALNRISGLKKLHIIAAFNEEILSQAFGSFSLASGYLNKVFTCRVEIPLPIPSDLRAMAIQYMAEHAVGDSYPQTRALFEAAHPIHGVESDDRNIVPHQPRHLFEVVETMMRIEDLMNCRWKGDEAVYGNIHELFELTYVIKCLQLEYPEVFAELRNSRLETYFDKGSIDAVVEKEGFESVTEHDGISVYTVESAWRTLYPHTAKCLLSDRNIQRYRRFFRGIVNNPVHRRRNLAFVQNVLDLVMHNLSDISCNEVCKVMSAMPLDYKGSMRDLIAKVLNITISDTGTTLKRFWFLMGDALEHLGAGEEKFRKLLCAIQNDKKEDYAPAVLTSHILINLANYCVWMGAEYGQPEVALDCMAAMCSGMSCEEAMRLCSGMLRCNLSGKITPSTSFACKLGVMVFCSYENQQWWKTCSSQYVETTKLRAGVFKMIVTDGQAVQELKDFYRKAPASLAVGAILILFHKDWNVDRDDDSAQKKIPPCYWLDNPVFDELLELAMKVEIPFWLPDVEYWRPSLKILDDFKACMDEGMRMSNLSWQVYQERAGKLGELADKLRTLFDEQNRRIRFEFRSGEQEPVTPPADE